MKLRSNSHRKVSQIAYPKVGGSNPPPATMNATAEMQWRSPVYRSFNSLKSALRLPQNQFEDLVAGLLPRRGSGSIDYFLFADRPSRIVVSRCAQMNGEIRFAKCTRLPVKLPGAELHLLLLR